MLTLLSSHSRRMQLDRWWHGIDGESETRIHDIEPVLVPNCLRHSDKTEAIFLQQCYSIDSVSNLCWLECDTISMTFDSFHFLCSIFPASLMMFSTFKFLFFRLLYIMITGMKHSQSSTLSGLIALDNGFASVYALKLWNTKFQITQKKRASL